MEDSTDVVKTNDWSKSDLFSKRTSIIVHCEKYIFENKILFSLLFILQEGGSPDHHNKIVQFLARVHKNFKYPKNDLGTV